MEAKRREKEDKEKRKEEMKRIVEEEKQRRKEEKERMKVEKERVSCIYCLSSTSVFKSQFLIEEMHINCFFRGFG